MSTYENLKDELSAAPKKWLITGVAGFIGSNLLETLIKLDQRVIGLDNFSSGKKKNLDEVRGSVEAAQWAPLYNRAGYSRHRRIIGSPLLHTPAVPCRSPARAASADYCDVRRITEPGWSCSVGFLRDLRLGIVLVFGFWGFNRERNERSCTYPGLLTAKKVMVCKYHCLFHSKNRVNLP